MTDTIIKYLNEKLHVEKYLINQTINDGFSGAEVYMIKIISEDLSLSGYYVIKSCDQSEETTQSEADVAKSLYDTAQNYRSHLVELYATDKLGDKTVMIYTYANNSVHDSCALTNLDSEHVRCKSKIVSCELLDILNKDAKQTTMGFGTFLGNLLSKRLDCNGRFSSRINELLDFPNSDSISFGDIIYPNINYYLECPEELDTRLKESIIFTGIIHGDLHGLNIIVSDSSYSLIDYDSVKTGMPLLFDQAYLELSVYLDRSKDNDLKAWNKLLDHLIMPHFAKNTTSFEKFYEHSIREGICEGIVEWLKKNNYDSQIDDIEIQFTMARIAAGINFLCKKSTKSIGKMTKILFYISYCLKKLLELVRLDYKPNVTSKLKSSTVSEDNCDFWNDFLKYDYTMVLITNDAYSNNDATILQHLTLTNWSLVIDIGEDNKAPVVYPSLNKHRKNNVVKKIDITADNTTDCFQGTLNVLSVRRANDVDFNTLWRIYKEQLTRVIDLFYAFNQHKPIVFVFDCQNKSTAFANKLFSELFYKNNPQNTRFVYLGSEFPEQCMDEFEQLKKNKKWSFLAYPNKSLLDVSHTLALYLDYSAIKQRKVILPSVNGEIELSESDLLSYDTTIELVYSGCQHNIDKTLDDPEAGVSFGESFYKGNEATWEDIGNHYDLELVDRRKYETICEKILSYAEDGSQRIKLFKLLHGAGTGGTTLSKRILWDLKEQLPCARLKKYSDRTADIIFELYQKTGKAVLLFVEKGSMVISDEEMNKLISSIYSRNGKLIIIQNIRTDFDSAERSENTVLCTLNDTMPVLIAQNFEKKFGDFAKNKEDGEDRIEQLKKITRDSQQRSPFFYGFYTFQEEYNCLERLTQTVNQSDENSKILLSCLALVTIFSQNICVSFSEIKEILNQTGEWNRYSISECIPTSIRKLLINRDDGYRICHKIIAEKILNLLYRADSGTNIFMATRQYIQIISKIYGTHNGYADDILKELIIDRPYLDYDQKRTRFSLLVEKITTWSNKKDLFELLIKTFPDNPHYYNHMARLLAWSYKKDDITPNFTEAIEYAIKSVNVAKTNKSTHMTTLAWIYGQKVIYMLDGEIKQKRKKHSALNIEMMIDAIRTDYNLAFEQFEKARRDSGDFERSSYCYYPQISLECKIISKLIDLGDGQGICQMIKLNKVFEKWYTEHFNIAVTLFLKMQNQFDDSEEYVKSARDKLSDISMDYDRRIVERLTDEYESDEEDSVQRRRSMVNNLYAKSGFKYASIDKKALQVAEKCLWRNIQCHPADDQELYHIVEVEMWFELYRRTNYFDPCNAQAMITDYMPNGYKRSYYLFIIDIIMRLSGHDIGTYKIYDHINESKRLANSRGLNTLRELDAYVDVSKTKNKCPVVTVSEIQRDNDRNPIHLVSFTGEITDVEQTHGKIMCQELNMDVTFTPNPTKNDAHKFGRRDIGTKVRFNLMFSYSGLRAWNVTKIDKT